MPINDYKNVWIFAQVNGWNLDQSAYGLLTAARALADQLGEKVCAVVLGKNLPPAPQKLIAHGADIVYTCDSEHLEHFTDDVGARVLADMIAQYKPNKFLFPATHLGRALAARTAVLAGTGLTAHATELSINKQDGQLYATRPTFGGNLLATITCVTRPEMCTLDSACYAFSPEQKEHRGEIVQFPFDAKKYTPLAKLAEFIYREQDPLLLQKSAANLANAQVIVAGGRGVGSKENFELLRRLAAKLGGVVGATRPAVDNGWIEKSAQIGVTGKSVNPKLYIACGISGQLHHTAGIGKNAVIVAINKDPNAPLMKTAQYALTGDLCEIIPALLNALK